MGNITQRLMLMKRIICTGFLLIRMPGRIYASPKTIMERLGHKNIKTTLERYITNAEKMQDQAVALFEAATTKIVYR